MTDVAQETIDYIAIHKLLSTYADVVNRRAWSELRELFRPDTPVRVDTVTNPAIDVTGPDELGAFIGGAVERFEFFEFALLNCRIDVHPGGDTNAARARVFMCELRQEAGNGHWSNAYGVYHDDFRRVDGRWWFARRRYQSLARTGRGEVFPFPHHFAAEDAE